MYKYFIIIMLAGFFTGCLEEKLDMPNVTITPNNLNISVNDTIDFMIDRNSDNIVFYSGEFGHRYAKKDSFLVKASLELSYGTLGTFWLAPSKTMSLWYSTNFVSFSEFDAKSKTPAQYWSDATWNQITDAKFSSVITGNNADLNSDAKFLFDTIAIDFVKAENVTFAFKLVSNGETRGNIGIRNVKFSAVSPDLQAPIQIAGKANGWRNITLQAPVGKSPIWKDRDVVTWDILSVGASTSNMEMWAVLSPINTNKTIFNVPADKGIVIKDFIADSKESFKYSYNKPGTYKASFIVTNSSKTGTKFGSELIEFDITVSE